MTAQLCPQCGNTLPSDGPQGLCPACLLQAALPGQSALESAATLVPRAGQPATREAGTRIRYFGDYELLEQIAAGGMGVVWKARQTSLKRDVALKMIRTGSLASAEEVERFLREAEAAANLQHPNIVAIHEVGEEGGQHFFSMDFVEGRDLGALVKDGPMAPQRAARYVKIVAEAIHFAHQRGTLHRDLKPQNVLIDGADQPRITDFGLAKIMKEDSRLTQSGVVMGSPSYMPPEQAAGRHGDIGPASDVYSLGAMLYELLTGKAPFRGATVMDTLLEVMEVEPVSLRRLKPDIPPDLETICLKCLEKTPPARYPTARGLAEELDRFLKGEPIQAKPASAVRKAVSWARRHPNVLAIGAALVIVVLGFGVFYLLEENAFLRAQQLDPELARVPGALHESLEMWGMIEIWAVVAGFFLFYTVQMQARGLSWRQPVDLRNPFRSAGQSNRPLQALNDRIRRWAIGGSLVLICVGVWLLGMTIRVHVWEGASIWSQFSSIYICIYLGLAILGMVIRDYRLVHFGQSTRQPTPKQIEPIRRALEDRNWPAAIQHYQEAIPEHSRAEANRFVAGLFASLLVQDPDKFGPPPLTLSGLNWRAMAICVSILAILLGALYFIFPPNNTAADVSKFALCFLLGVGLTACLRVRGWRRRASLLLPSLAVLILARAVVPQLWEASSRPFVVCLFGLIAGVFLTLAGFTPSAKTMSGRSQRPVDSTSQTNA